MASRESQDRRVRVQDWISKTRADVLRKSWPVRNRRSGMGSGIDTVFSNSALRVGPQGFGCTPRTSTTRGTNICRSEAWQRRGRAAHGGRGRRILADAVGARGHRSSSIPCKWRVPMDGSSKTTMRPRSRTRSRISSARSWSCGAAPQCLSRLLVVNSGERRNGQRALTAWNRTSSGRQRDLTCTSKVRPFTPCLL